MPAWMCWMITIVCDKWTTCWEARQHRIWLELSHHVICVIICILNFVFTDNDFGWNICLHVCLLLFIKLSCHALVSFITLWTPVLKSPTRSQIWVKITAHTMWTVSTILGDQPAVYGKVIRVTYNILLVSNGATFDKWYMQYTKERLTVYVHTWLLFQWAQNQRIKLFLCMNGSFFECWIGGDYFG